MASRAIVCGFLFFAPLVYAQNNPVDRLASDFNSSGIGLTETLLRFCLQQNLPIAVEYVDRASMDELIAVNLQNKTVRQSLDAILRHGPGYSWRLRNGVIEITNRLVSKRAESQFDTVIRVFTIPDNETTKIASVMLWWKLQLRLDKTLKGFAGDVMGDARAPRVKGATLHNRTVREILAYIVVNSGEEGWIVPGPPECVGFTPYCGLWVLIEGEPTDPSYKTLLRGICENL